MIEPAFWGLPATGWTALSAVGTFLAVLVALGLPIWQSVVRRRNLEAIILRELAQNTENLSKFLNPPANDPMPLVTGKPTPGLIAMSRLVSLYTKAWERHRESLAELSFQRFTFYDDANQMIAMFRDRAEEAMGPEGYGVDPEFTRRFVVECLTHLHKAPSGIRKRLGLKPRR